MTNKALEQSLNKVLHEIRQMHRDFSLFLPTESIEEYENADQLKKSLKRTLQEYKKGHFATKL